MLKRDKWLGKDKRKKKRMLERKCGKKSIDLRLMLKKEKRILRIVKKMWLNVEILKERIERREFLLIKRDKWGNLRMIMKKWGRILRRIER